MSRMPTVLSPSRMSIYCINQKSRYSRESPIPVPLRSIFKECNLQTKRIFNDHYPTIILTHRCSFIFSSMPTQPYDIYKHIYIYIYENDICNSKAFL